MVNEPLTAHDPRLPLVRARVFALVRSLWKAGVIRLPLEPAPQREAWAFLPLVWRLLQVEMWGKVLAEQVLPGLERALHAGGEWESEDAPLPPTAPPDWPRTGRTYVQRRATPRPVVQRRWRRTFDLPENRLAAWGLDRLVAQARRLGAPLAAAGVRDALAVASALADRRRRPPWCWVTSPAPAEARRVEQAARNRIAALGSRRPAYRRLWAWWQQWRQWEVQSGGALPAEDPAVEPDRLFELLVLLELVRALGQRGTVRQVRPLAGPATAPLFVVNGPRRLRVYYQTGAMFRATRRLKEVVGIPDIVIELGEGGPYVLLDAKNYGPAHHAEALYKMMGYLYNFGYPDRFEAIRAGALAFSTAEREGTGLYRWSTTDGGQSLLSFVVPPVPERGFTGMEAFVALLFQ